MKYSQWTIGSTTVRNPDRLREGLQVLSDSFENKEWDTEQQEKFFDLLCEKGIYEAPEEGEGEISSARKQEHGRKWISVLNQLGFCFAYESSGKPVLITDAGKALLANPEIEDEIFLRQLLKYQKPCALPKQHGASFSDVSVLPFVVGLRIVNELQGLSKEEISIFLNTTVRMADIEEIISKIKKYRARKAELVGNVKKREFYFATQLQHVGEIFKDEIVARKELIKELVTEAKKDNRFLASARGKELLAGITKGGKGSNTTKARQTQRAISDSLRAGGNKADIEGIFLGYFLPLKAGTLKDYADLTARYLRKSGLFTINRDRIVVITEKAELVKYLLRQQWDLIGDNDYLEYLWSDATPTLPTDNEEYLKARLAATQQKEQELAEKIGAVPPAAQPAPTGLLQLKQQSRLSEDNLLRLKEMEFYGKQRTPEQIEDILNVYDLISTRGILGGEAYYPAYLEWNTWRLFLAINTLANKPYEARGFKIDEDLQPIHHSPGNRPDMVFEYDDFVLVTEVTLSVRANQWSTEAEPVPRHVAKIQSENEGKEVFGLFVAPQIDNNTVLTFFNSRQYSVADKILNLTIIPLTVDQLKKLLSVFKVKQFSVVKLKALLGAIKSSIGTAPDALAWHKGIPQIINTWETTI